MSNDRRRVRPPTLMATSIRRLFTRDRTSPRWNNETRPLTTQSYDATIAEQAPVRGSDAVPGNGNGNGSIPKDLAARPPAELVANAPDVPRARSRSDAGRPLTAPQSSYYPLAQFEVHVRTRSGLSTSVPPALSGPQSRPGSVSSAYNFVRNLSTRQRANSIGPRASDASYTSRRTAHVDIVQAASYTLPPLHMASSQRAKALGERDYGEDVADRNIAHFGVIDERDALGGRDYGEDVADRNIAKFGGYELKYAHLHASESGDEPMEISGGQQGEKLDALGGSKDGGDGTGDDTLPRRQHGHGPGPAELSQSTIGNHSGPVTPSLGSYRGAIGNTSNGRRGTSLTEIPPAPAETGSGVSASRPLSSIASTDPYTPSHTRNDSTFSEDSDRVDLTAMSASNVRNFQEKKMNGQQTKYSPPVSRPPKQNILPTPPISPTRGYGTTPIPRRSLEQESPQDSGSHVRVHSEDIAAVPSEASSKITNGSRDSRAQSDVNDETVRPRVDQKEGQVFGGPSRDALLKGFTGPSKTTDTEVITTERPAIVHEYVMPRVHHIAEEHITREIHHHDVFHRIQPIIDVEILPTKHYIPSPNGDGLVEIPAPTIAGRQIDYQTRPVSAKARSPNHTAPGSTMEPIKSHSRPLSSRAAIMTNTRKSVTDAGYPRRETTWHHPAQSENGGYETGQTTSLNFFYDDNDDEDYEDNAAVGDVYWDASSEQDSSVHGGEEELLFKDSEQAFGGRLPGLEDFNPAVQGALFPPPAQQRPVSHAGLPPISEKGDEDSLKARSQMQVDPVARQMEGLRVEE